MVRNPPSSLPRAPTGTSSRERLVDALRWADLTVEELAAELGLTLNGVRAQLTGLERDGLVRRAGLRHAGTAGKPPVVYGLTQSAMEQLSDAYPPALRALIEELGERLGGTGLTEVLAGAGRRLARTVPGTTPANLLESIGARVALRQDETGITTIEGAGCPLGSVVAGAPVTCELVRSMLATSLGADVAMCCQHGERPACRFRIETPST